MEVLRARLTAGHFAGKQLAVNVIGNAEAVAFHEVLDAVDKVFDLLEDARHGRITRRARAVHIALKFLGDDFLKDAGVDFEINSRILEEIIAKEFEGYVNGTRPPRDPAVARIFQKIKDFIDRIQNFMEGNGFRIADDVYRKLLAGEMAGRKPGTQNFHYASEDYASEPESNPDEGRKITESNLNLDYLNSPENIKDMLGAISEYNAHFTTQ